MAELYRYAAFISYSSKDAKFAQRLHRALESYGIPSSLGKFDLIGGGKPNRIYPVFRDREELSAGHLGNQIEANLKASAALIVVCSPNGAASPWVQKEIEFFAAQGRHAKIFAIIPDTAPLVDDAGADCTQSCFPPAFRGDALSGDKLEPLAADARKGKDGFRNAWLKIVAGMIGVTPGQIIDRDKKLRRTQRRVLAASVLVATLVVLEGLAWVDARNWRAQLTQEAIAASDRSLEATTLAIGGLPAAGAAILLVGPNAADVLSELGGAVPVVEILGPRAFFGRDEELLVFDAQSNALVRDLEDEQEITPLGNLDAQIIQFSPDRRFLLARSDYRASLLDLETGSRSAFEDVDAFVFDPESEVLITRERQSHTWTVRNLFDGSTETFAGLNATAAPPVMLARGARYVATIDNFGEGSLRDTATGAVRALGTLDERRPFEFSPNGALLLLRPLGGNTSLLDLSNGSSRDLGSLSVHQFSADGRWLVTKGRRDLDPGFLHNLITGVTMPLGSLSRPLPDVGIPPPVFSATGLYLIIRDLEGVAWLLSTTDGVRRRLGEFDNFDFAGEERVLLFAEGGSSYLYDIASQSRVSLGHVDYVLASRSGRFLISRQEGRLALRDTARSFSEGSPPRRCKVAPQGVQPFVADTRARLTQLRGRPWNPCDWRGLLAIFPNASRGDGWFEGARQWLRLLKVRLGGADYACEETTSAASAETRARRRDMCERFANQPAPAPT